MIFHILKIGGHVRSQKFCVTLICAILVVQFAQAATWAARAIGGTPMEKFKSLIQTKDGGYLGVGESVYVQGFSFYFRSWVAKMDANGAVKWHKVISGGFIDSLNTALETSDGSFVIGGDLGSKAYAAKLSAAGNFLWEWTYPGTNSSAIYAIRPATGGGYIVAGTLYTTSFDAWCLRLDEAGQIVWQETFGGSKSDYAYAVQPIKSGGYFVSGDTASFGAGGYDAWVLKLDSSGKVLWQKTLGGSKDDFPHFSAMAATSDGSCIIAGSTKSFGAGEEDGWIIKLDKAGKIKWQKAVGGKGDDICYAVRQTSDKGYIVAGETESSGAGGADAWTLKLNPSGNVVWQYSHGGAKTESLRSILQVADGSYLAGGGTSTYGVGTGNGLILRIATTGFVCNPLSKKSTATTVVTSAKAKASAATVTATAVTPVKPSFTNASPTASNALICSR